ncbi:MAG: hypothetical protein AAFX87_12980 [Bacteroidota bacterium]
MNNTLRLLVTLTFLCMADLVRAQDASPITSPNVIPPSPEAASLGKFVDLPVSLYTGVPQISVPIYTIQGRGLNLPVSISYHASGLKVEEIGSWIGSGWTLNATGVVSRTIRGKADEKVRGYFTDDAPILANDLFEEYTCSEFTQTQYEYSNELASGCYDAEADSYFFRVPGKSGRFVFDHDRNLYLLPHQAIKIEHPYNGAIPTPAGSDYQWKITAEDGTKYVLGRSDNGTVASERTTVQNTPAAAGLSVCYDGTNLPTTWNLLEIISPSGRDTIRYEYEAETTQYTIDASVSIYDPIQGNGPSPAGEVNNMLRKQEMTVNGQRLRRILSTTGHRIEFEADMTTGRSDLQGGRRLKAIKVFYKDELIRTFNLTHSYFQAAGAPVGISLESRTTNTDTYSNYALKLDRIQEVGLNGKALPDYVFTYNGNFRPSRHSKDKDHWGYFNNANNLTTLLPAMTRDTDQVPLLNLGEAVPAYRVIDYAGANRESNDWLKLGVLKQIQYPTGGYAAFDYELNDYYEPHVIKPADSIEFEMNYNATQDVKEQTFTLTQDRHVRILSNVPVNSINGHTTGNPFLYLKLYKKEGSNYTLFDNLSIPQNGYGRRTKLPAGDYKIRARMKSYTCNCTVTPISCFIDELQDDPNVESIDDILCQADFTGQQISLKLWWQVDEAAGTNLTDKKGAGLRVKKVTLSEGDNLTPDIVKEYYYKNNTTGTSSGALRTPIVYMHTAYGHNGTPPADGTSIIFSDCHYDISITEPFWTYIVRSSQSNLPMLSLQGSPIGYGEVTVYNVDANQIGGDPLELNEAPPAHQVNGKSVFFYTNASAATPTYISEFPLVPDHDDGHRFGLLQKQVDYKYEAGAYVKVREVENTYTKSNFEYNGQVVDENIVRSSRYARQVMTACKVCDLFDSFSGLYVPTFTRKEYIDISDLYQLTNATETVYDQENVNIQLINTTTFNYDPVTLLVSSQVQTTSEGQVITTVKKYPSDYTGISILNEMVSRNILTPVIEQQVRVANPIDIHNPTPNTSGLTSGQVTTYKEAHGIILPDQVYLVNSNAPIVNFTEAQSNGKYTAMVPNGHYEARLTYDTYAENGNMLSVLPADGIRRSYIWGYDETYPVAEVVDATPGQLYYNGYEEDDAAVENPSVAYSGNRYRVLTNQAVIVPTASLPDQSGHYILSYMFKPNGTGDWEYREVAVNYGVGSPISTIVTTGWVDEVRLYPADAHMTTYTYDAARGLMTSTVDPNYLVSYYEYDDLGRLLRIKDHEGNILKTYDYNYRRDN